MSDFKQKRNKVDTVTISVIEETHLELPFEVSLEIPISKFDVDTLNIDTSKKYFLICNKGILSYMAAELLKEKYPNLSVFSLKGGIKHF
jgi:rhodanese-related sulfurtransferase